MKRILTAIVAFGLLTAAAWAAGTCCKEGADCCAKSCCKRAR